MYSTDKKWVMKTICYLIGFDLLIGYVLFDSVFYGLLAAPLFPFFYKEQKQRYLRAQKDIMRKEFKDVIEVMSGSLSAGYSLENAVLSAEIEMGKATNEIIYMGKELNQINNGIKLGYRVEDMFIKLGEKSEISEIEEFGQLISAAKKYGGNIIQLIKRTHDNITQKSVIELEIKTMIASKNLEGKIMLAMPFGIILYMRMTNSSYIEGLYNNILGKIIMVVALYVWFAAKCMIEKIIRSVEND